MVVGESGGGVGVGGGVGGGRVSSAVLTVVAAGDWAFARKRERNRGSLAAQRARKPARAQNRAGIRNPTQESNTGGIKERSRSKRIK